MATADLDPTFRLAEHRAPAAQEAFLRSHRYLTAWLAQADPASGLIPRNLRESRDFWNGRDSAADNYAFMVLVAAMTDRPLFEGPIRRMLRTEAKLTARLDRLTDDYSFSHKTWRRQPFDLEATLFDSAEYVKDGLVPITEWLGPSPWSRRMIGIQEDIWKHATNRTHFGRLPTSDFEVHGDLLQSAARIYWLTGQRRHLEGAIRIGDFYLLGTNHPTRNGSRLRLRDHGCEVINGLTELYVALRNVDPARASRYREPLHAIFQSILARGRNSHGLLYDWYNPQTGDHSTSLCDTWGYVYDGFYTLFLVDHVPEFRTATREALASLAPHYRNHAWEGASADGYADAIEGALSLLNREPVPSVPDWIDSEIRVMWAKQQADGIIEGWHGDGNFARTSLMYALWKTQGVIAEPWRPDLRLGAALLPGQQPTLCIHLSADQPWSGRIRFDRPRHRDFLHLPLDYPRINQFPEWFTVEAREGYLLQTSRSTSAREVRGRELHQGLAASLPGSADKIEWTVRIQRD